MSNLAAILTTIYTIFIFIFSLLFLINCIRYRKEVKAYVKYGIILGFALIVLDAAILPFIGSSFFELMSVYELIAINGIVFIKIAVFTCVGMYYCSILNCPDIPLVRKLFHKSDVSQKVINKNYIISVVSIVVAAVAFSLVLFKLTSPQMSEWLKQLSEVQMAKMGIGTGPSIIVALVGLEFAFGEEIIFRLGIQNHLAKIFKLDGSKYWVAIVLTSVLWSFAHASILDPEWVKVVQIFPMGLALGFLFRKFGVEACIFTHGAFNLIMMFLGPFLITS